MAVLRQFWSKDGPDAEEPGREAHFGVIIPSWVDKGQHAELVDAVDRLAAGGPRGARASTVEEVLGVGVAMTTAAPPRSRGYG